MGRKAGKARKVRKAGEGLGVSRTEALERLGGEAAAMSKIAGSVYQLSAPAI